jgi:hypothetical protein
VGSVTERAVTAVLATAEINRTIFLSGVGSWSEVASLVGSIAERLRGAFTAGAPVVGLTGFNLDRNGRLLGNDRFGHKSESWGFGD